VVVEARAAVVVDGHPVAVDKVAEVVVAVRPEVEAADKVVEDKEAVVVVATRPEAGAEAAETVSTSSLGGASRSRGAPLFY
jgi:beta-lactam-binding protein with PASTA domain